MKKQTEVFHPSGDASRVQSLNSGQHVRIFDHMGKSHHMSTRDLIGLAALLDSVRSDSPEMYERIGNELADIGITVPDVVDVVHVGVEDVSDD